MTTRAELLQDLDAWLARDDLAADADAPTMLRIAESTINRRVRVRAQETTTTLTPSSRFTALPADYLAMRALTLDSALDRSITYLTPDRIREAPIWNNQGGGITDNTALAFTIEGTNLVLAPAPTSAITVDLVYYAKFPALVDGADTNWLLTNHYDVYLWAILMAAAVFLDDAALEAKYENRFERAVADLERNERFARFPGGKPLIATGNPRMTV